MALFSFLKKNPSEKNLLKKKCIIFVNTPDLGLMLADIKKMPNIFPDFSKTFLAIQKLEKLVDKSVVRINPENFVFSFTMNNKVNLFEVLRKISEIQLSLLELGIDTSGAVIYDDIFHDKERIFGPGLKRVIQEDTKFRHHNNIIIPSPDLNKLLALLGKNELASKQISQIRQFISNPDGKNHFINANNLLGYEYGTYISSKSINKQLEEAHKLIFKEDK